MKVLIFAFGLLGADPSEFCEGYRAGYAEGWCGKFALQCDPPKHVTCPVPATRDLHSYWAGFAQGESAGTAHDARLVPMREKSSSGQL